MLDKLIELLKTPNKAGILRREHNRIFTDADDQEMIIAEFLVTNGVVVQKHGRWINPYINRYGHPCHCCSVCGFKASYQDKNYCPNCGAKMDRKEDT